MAIDNKCKSCGATIPLKPGLAVMVCPYCGSVQPIPAPPPGGGGAQPPSKFMVRTTADVVRLRELVRAVIAGDRDAPEDILSSGRIVEESFVFHPMWYCEGSYRSHWSASFGFYRDRPGPAAPAPAPEPAPPPKPLTRAEAKAQAKAAAKAKAEAEARAKAEAKRAKKGKSKSAPAPQPAPAPTPPPAAIPDAPVDWRPASGGSVGRFTRLVFAGDRRALPEEAIRRLEAETSEDAVEPLNPLVLGGLEARDPVMGERDAARLVRAWVEDGPALETARGHAKGDVQRDWAVDTEVIFEGPPRLWLVPMAEAVYEYRGRRYRFWFEGASFSSEWHDPLPKAPPAVRARRRIGGCLPFGAALAAAMMLAALAALF